VELIEMPFTVITCADVLLVNLERVGFNLRNFDMTIVFKVCTPLAPGEHDKWQGFGCTDMAVTRGKFQTLPQKVICNGLLMQHIWMVHDMLIRRT
jgi:Histone chaperone Rttp106-like